MSTLNPITGTLGRKRAKHLLSRLTFGVSKNTIDTFAGYTIAQALSQLFPTAAAALPARPAWLDGTGEGFEEFNQQGRFKAWWLRQMYADNTSLEKLTFFMHTVLTTKMETVNNTEAVFWQNQMLRRYVINDFANINPTFNRYKQLIEKICIDNAMLTFLDGRLNESGNPNENFGRELFELYTIGKGPTAGVGDYTNYTEDDIRTAALVLTGWRNNFNFDTTDDEVLPGFPIGTIKNSTLNPNQAIRHDNRPVKQFSNRFQSAAFPDHSVRVNAALLNPDGSATRESALDEIRQMIDMVYEQNQAARYICRKIYRFFVYHDIITAPSTDGTDRVNIEETIIAPLATTFISNGFRLQPVFQQLFSSQHFFDTGGSDSDGSVRNNNVGALIKSPLDVTLGLMKFFDVPAPAEGSMESTEIFGSIVGNMRSMALDFMEPFDVAGYDPYHQAPNYQRNWITVNNLASRYNFARRFFNGEIVGFGAMGTLFDALTWTKNNANLAAVATDTQAFVQEVLRYTAGLNELNTEITQERLNFFESELLKLGRAFVADPTDIAQLRFYWTFQWNNNTPDANGMLIDFYNAVFQSPEYQLG